MRLSFLPIRVISTLALFVPTAAALAVPSQPVADVNVDTQLLGFDPVAAVGQVDAFGGVTVDAPRAGLGTLNTLKFQRTSTPPRMTVTPLGPVLTAGQRTLTFDLNYDAIGTNGAVEPELMDIRLVDSHLNNLLRLVISGNGTNSLTPTLPASTLGLVVNDATTATVPFALNVVHTFQIDVDADAKTFTVVIDATTNVGSANMPWPMSITDLALLDLQFASRAPAAGISTGELHIDSLLMVDPNSIFQEWTGSGDGTNWTDNGNWNTMASPTAGTVFIRTATTGDILSPGAALNLSGLLIGLSGGQASLHLTNNLDAGGLNVSAGGKVVVPTGSTLHVGTGWALAGTLRMEGGTLNGEDFANGPAGTISGFGTISAGITSGAATSTIRGEASQILHLDKGSINHKGTLDCNGGRIELGSSVSLLGADNATVSLSSGTLRSPNSCMITSLTGHLNGPGTLEIGGTFGTALPAANMMLDAVNITLIADATLEGLTRDQVKNNHALTGLANVINALNVGAHTLTLRDDFHNDGSSGGESVLYVRNLDLTGTTHDVVGGRVYYENLVGGTNTFTNFISIQNTAPNGTIDSPASDTTVEAGQIVTFSASATDDAGTTGITYLWSFGGSGINDSTAKVPGAIAFPTAGTFTVTMTVTDSEGLADPTPATRVITVTAVPVDNNSNTNGDGNTNGTDDTTTPTTPNNNMCGVCGASSPFLSMLFLASYTGFILRRRAKRR